MCPVIIKAVLVVLHFLKTWAYWEFSHVLYKYFSSVAVSRQHMKNVGISKVENREYTVYLLYSRVLHWHAILNHWGRVTHICVSDITNIGSDNGLSPGRRQAIIRTNAEILFKRPLRTNFSEMLIEIHIFPFTKIHLKMSSEKWRPFCIGLNELNHVWVQRHINLDRILKWPRRHGFIN